MVSFSKKKDTKSRAVNETVFPKKFFEEAYNFFGGEPDYSPEYIPLSEGGPEKLEKALYQSQVDKLSEAYDRARARRREELSQSGLLTSPAAYAEGGALDILDKDMLRAQAEAGRQAQIQRYGLEEREAGRETEFSVDVATKLLNAFLQKLAIASSAGRTSTSTSSGGGGFSFGLSL